MVPDLLFILFLFNAVYRALQEKDKSKWTMNRYSNHDNVHRIKVPAVKTKEQTYSWHVDSMKRHCVLMVADGWLAIVIAALRSQVVKDRPKGAAIIIANHPHEDHHDPLLKIMKENSCRGSWDSSWKDKDYQLGSYILSYPRYHSSFLSRWLACVSFICGMPRERKSDRLGEDTVGKV